MPTYISKKSFIPCIFCCQLFQTKLYVRNYKQITVYNTYSIGKKEKNRQLSSSVHFCQTRKQCYFMQRNLMQQLTIHFSCLFLFCICIVLFVIDFSNIIVHMFCCLLLMLLIFLVIVTVYLII